MKCGIFCLCFFAWDFCLRFLFGGCFARCYLLAVGFLARFSSEKHTPCGFPLASSLKKHTFHSTTYRLASGLCFLARFSSKKHTSCVFPLTSSLKTTLFAYVRVDASGLCLLAFLLKNTRHVFFCLLLLSKTQFSLRDCMISFRGVFSRSLFF